MTSESIAASSTSYNKEISEISLISDSKNRDRNRIFWVTEGTDTVKTAITYEHVFKLFLKHIKIDDLQILIDYSKTRPQIIKEMIVDYVLYMRDEKPGKKLSRSSIKVHLAAILHFFQINNDDFHLTTRHFKMHLPSDEFTQFDDVAYTRDQIARILQACDVRSRVMIFLMASSGMRIGALRTLRIGDLDQVMENDSPLPFYKIQVYAGTRDKYFTYCSFECYHAIQEYFRYRRGLKENLTSSAPLIREQFNVDNPITINVPRFLSEPTINYIIYDVVKRSRIFDPDSKIKKNVQTSHGLRKFFMTTCEHSGMKSINVKLLMGHNIGVSGHYYSPSELDIFEDYKTHAADALIINSEQSNLIQYIEK